MRSDFSLDTRTLSSRKIICNGLMGSVTVFVLFGFDGSSSSACKLA